MTSNGEPEVTLAGTLRAWLLHPVLDRLSIMEQTMADVSEVLDGVAAGLSGPLTMSIQELIAENAAQAVELAALKGEDVRESTAAANVKTAFDGVAALFAPAEVPSVPALPDPSTDPAPADPVPADGGA